MKKQLLFKLLTLTVLLMAALSASALDIEAGYNQGYKSMTNTAKAEPDFVYQTLNFAITGPNTVTCLGPSIAPQGPWIIPDEAPFEGTNYRVTAIGNNAFFNCREITSITLGCYVEEIGAYAFYLCTGMESIDLKNVIRIGAAALGDCTGLTEVTIPNTVTSIGAVAFTGCTFTAITIPSSVQSIEERVFFNCPNLKAIYVHDDNPNYRSSNGALYSKDMTYLVSYPIGHTRTEFTVPEGVTSIAAGTFGYCQYLRSVTLPKSMTNIGAVAFCDMPSLTDLTCLAETPPSASPQSFSSTIENSDLILSVPRGCKETYEAAEVWQDFPTIKERYHDFKDAFLFYRITSENTVEVTCDDPDTGGHYNAYTSLYVPPTVMHEGKNYTVTSIGSYAFSNCHYLQEMELPSTITTIDWGAFYNCRSLYSINLPENLTTIETYAFYGCYSLGNVEIPDKVTWLGTYAFANCSALTEVHIPNSVQTINYGAFYSCTRLEKISIGSGVGGIGDYAFYNCPSLTTIICNATTPPYINNGTFLDTHYANASLLVPKGKRSTYQSANNWSNFANISEVAYDFEEGGIFYNIASNNPAEVRVTYMTSDYNSYSGKVNIPATVTHNGTAYTVVAIGNNAFRKCKSLKEITLPNTIRTIDNKAFYYCDSLTHVDIPNSVTTIAGEAFWICQSLEEAIIPNSVTTIGFDAFRNCTAMRRVVIGENVTSIGTTCFMYNPNITEVTCLAATPPTLYDSGTNTTFVSAVYQNAVLRVPYDSHAAYRDDTNWGRFANIVSEEVIAPTATGDVNGDNKVSIADVTALINLLLSGESGSSAAADVNGDNKVSIADVTALINMLLSGETGSSTAEQTVVNYLINTVPFTMVKVDGGTFMMGLEEQSNAVPVHEVTLSDYFIGQTEVTQALWTTVMGSNTSHFTGDSNLPAESMDWNQCQDFTFKLSKLTGKNFRLPTEAEWEFAARGGNKSQGYTYAGSNNLTEVAWYSGNSSSKTHVVATKAPNELGLYDMSGNVFEWCQDYFDDYTSEAQVNPQGPNTGEYRVCRSGAFNRPNNSWFKCGGRTYDSPGSTAYDSGLRVACGE